jgi:hypothetical protein
MSTTFALNFQDLFEINTTPLETTATWSRLAAGISGADPSNNEDVAQDKYLDGDGFGSSDVIGAQVVFAFSGHRVISDDAQDWIASIAHELGAYRKTQMRYTDAEGNVSLCACTVANIEIGGGDAAAKKEIAFEVHFNGKPTDTPKSAAAALTATVAAGAATGTTKFIATAGAGDTLSYKLAASSAGTVYAGQYVEGDIPYTSAADIAASVGQHLQMFELNANGRVVKFSEQVLASGDIKA